MDFLSLCQLLWTRLQNIGASLTAYLTLRTATLSRQSEVGPLRERVEHTASLACLAVVTLLLVTWLLLGQASPPFDVLVRACVLGLIGSVVLAAPLAIALKLTSRRPAYLFIGSLVSIQQVFLILVVGASSLVLVSVEPARTDFTLLRSNMGSHTLAYRHLCQPFSDQAQVYVNIRNSGLRTQAVIDDIREIERWKQERFPPTGDALTARWTAVEAQYARRKAEIAQTEIEQRQHAEMQRAQIKVRERFVERYPSVRWSIGILIVGVLTLVVMTSIHLWKAAVWTAIGWKRKLTGAGSLILAWGGSAVLICAVAYLSIPRTIELPPNPLDGVNARSMSPDQVEALMKVSEERNAALGEDLASEISRLRQQVHNARFLCPTVDGRGLW